jgi:hypothetical protein
MWRLLDLRTGKYISVITITNPEEWEMYECLTNYLEQATVLDVYQFVQENCSINISQSTVDKQHIIEEVIPIEFLKELVGSNCINNQYQGAVRLYLDECLIETFPEYRSKKKAMLELHRHIGTKARHFYEAVDMEIQDG